MVYIVVDFGFGSCPAIDLGPFKAQHLFGVKKLLSKRLTTPFRGRWHPSVCSINPRFLVSFSSFIHLLPSSAFELKRRDRHSKESRWPVNQMHRPSLLSRVLVATSQRFFSTLFTPSPSSSSSSSSSLDLSCIVNYNLAPELDSCIESITIDYGMSIMWCSCSILIQSCVDDSQTLMLTGVRNAWNWSFLVKELLSGKWLLSNLLASLTTSSSFFFLFFKVLIFILIFLFLLLIIVLKTVSKQRGAHTNQLMWKLSSLQLLIPFPVIRTLI